MRQESIISDQEADICQWLQSHPDFFARYPELMPTAARTEGARVISLEDGEGQLLRRQNEQLRTQLETIVAQIRRNEEIYRTFQAVQLRMIAAETAERLFAAATEQVEALFALQRVTVALSEEETLLREGLTTQTDHNRVNSRLIFLQQIQLVEMLGTPGATAVRLGREGPYHETLFGDFSGTIHSEALVPLQMDNRLIGSFNLGSTAPDRFLPGDSSDLLQHLADIFILCLTKVVREK